MVTAHQPFCILVRLLSLRSCQRRSSSSSCKENRHSTIPTSRELKYHQELPGLVVLGIMLIVTMYSPLFEGARSKSRWSCRLGAVLRSIFFAGRGVPSTTQTTLYVLIMSSPPKPMPKVTSTAYF